MYGARLMAENVNMLCDLYLTSGFASPCDVQLAILAIECNNSSMQHCYSYKTFKQPEMFPAYVT